MVHPWASNRTIVRAATRMLAQPRPVAGSSSAAGPARLGGNQILGPGLEFAVQPLDRLESVDLVDALVEPQTDDAREAQGEARLVARGALEDIERDLDHHRRLDQTEAAELADVCASNQRVMVAISASVRPV